MEEAIKVGQLIEILRMLDPEVKLVQDGDPVIGVRTLDNYYPDKVKVTEVEFIFADSDFCEDDENENDKTDE